MCKSWDILVLTAGNKSQKEAFDSQMDAIVDSYQDSEYCPFKRYRIYVDQPDNVKIGSGGATLIVLDNLLCEFGDELLLTFRILLIHAGGYSQRQPNSAALGKIFAALPRKENRRNSICTILHAKLDSYFPLLIRMSPGIFIAASDTLEHLNISINQCPAFNMDGFAVLAHPSHPDIGLNHGVYVLDHVQKEITSKVYCTPVVRVLQKPSVVQMKEAGAINLLDNEREQIFTDSAYFMSSSVILVLLRFYYSHLPLSCEIDCYGDFLQPLGVNADMNYINESTRIIGTEGNDGTLKTRNKVRLDLFDSLKPFAITAVVFTNSTFYHIGTLNELLHHLCDVSNGGFGEHFACRNSIILSSIANNSAQLSPETRIMCSTISAEIKTTNRTIIEFSHFESSIELLAECVISDCHYDRPFTLDVPLFITTIPLRTSIGLRYATIIFGIFDNVKDFASPSELIWLGKKSCFEASSKAKISLWTFALFPIAETDIDSFHASLSKVKTVLSGSKMTTNSEDICISMAESMIIKDVRTMLMTRTERLKMIQ